jgi:hypothetical protein
LKTASRFLSKRYAGEEDHPDSLPRSNRLFERAGFTVKRKKADHIIMTKKGTKRPLVIKTSPRLVPVTHIRTNMNTAGMTRDQYFRLLEEVQG